MKLHIEFIGERPHVLQIHDDKHVMFERRFGPNGKSGGGIGLTPAQWLAWLEFEPVEDDWESREWSELRDMDLDDVQAELEHEAYKDQAQYAHDRLSDETYAE